MSSYWHGSTPLPREAIEKLYGGLLTVVKRRDDVTKSRIRDVTAGVHGIHSSLIKNHHNRRSGLISGAPPSLFYRWEIISYIVALWRRDLLNGHDELVVYYTSTVIMIIVTAVMISDLRSVTWRQSAHSHKLIRNSKQLSQVKEKCARSIVGLNNNFMLFSKNNSFVGNKAFAKITIEWKFTKNLPNPLMWWWCNWW